MAEETRTPTYTIPSSFQRLDSNITSADDYVNVRDMQRLRLNHNVLLAQRQKHVLMSQNFTDGSNDYVELKGDRPVRTQAGFYDGPVVFSTQFRFSPYTKGINVNLRAANGNGSLGNSKLYAVLVDNESASISSVFTVSSASEATYTNTVQVTPSMRKSRLATFVLFFETPANTTADKTVGASDLVAVDWDWFQAVEASDRTGQLVVSSNADIEPRIIVQAQTGLGSSSTEARMWVNRPWNILPGNADTIYYHVVQGLRLYSMVIEERVVTDLFEDGA